MKKWHRILAVIAAFCLAVAYTQYLIAFQKI